MNHSDECWRIIAPLAQRAAQILAQEGDEYKDQIDWVNELRERGGGIRRTHPEAGASLVEEMTKLAARMAPRRPDDVMSLLGLLRTKLPASTVMQLKQQIDFRFPGTSCSVILQAEAELRRRAGPLPADCLALMSGTDPLVDDAEIRSLEERIRKIEEQQAEINQAEQERSEEEQREAKLARLNGNSGNAPRLRLEHGRQLRQLTPASKVAPNVKALCLP